MFDFSLAFCQSIAFVIHVVFIMFVVFLACCGVSSHISGLKRPLLIKIIQNITSQVYLHKLRVTNVESLMLMQQQYPRHRKLSIPKALIDEGMTSEMSKVLVKKLDVVTAGWDQESCSGFGQSWVLKPWRWLEKILYSRQSLSRQHLLMVPGSCESYESQVGFESLSRPASIDFFLGFKSSLPGNSVAKLAFF